MSNKQRPPKEHVQTGKPQASSGISQDVSQLRSKVEQLERQVQENSLEKNQWNAEIKTWIGKPVCVVMISSASVSGELIWVDRYTLCLRGPVPGLVGQRTVVVHKGAIAFMYQQEAA